jgi:hypothetical protein
MSGPEPDRPAFSATFAASLDRGKYTAWAARPAFSEEQLRALLWMVGEFAVHAAALLGLLYEQRQRFRGAERGYLALEALRCMVDGERFPAEEWPHRIQRNRGFLLVEDLPEHARTAVAGETWQRVMRMQSGYELLGKDSAGELLWAYVATGGRILSRGPHRLRGEPAEPSAFSPRLEEQLREHSQTRWAPARTLSEAHLRCLLWLVGEFSGRQYSIMEVLHEHAGRSPERQRAITALGTMERLVYYQERFGVDELLRRLASVRASAEFADLPAPVRAAMKCALPGAEWQAPLVTATGYAASGAAAGDGIVHVSRTGSVTVRRSMKLAELPPGARATVAQRIPSGRHINACSIGPDLATIHGYEVTYQPMTGSEQRICFDARGRECPPWEPWR